MKLIGIIGDPIRHSLSPLMHNTVLQAMKLPWVYLPFWVPPQRLKKFLKSIPDLNLVGFNVTIPHKEKALLYMDHLSPDAEGVSKKVSSFTHQDSAFNAGHLAKNFSINRCDD
ncbi:MAG: hypothetical protein HY073_00065 [Deltaproteobacteria bacterium]|nr:hypothetical protein [Deltaproteobacteria bacterium]